MFTRVHCVAQAPKKSRRTHDSSSVVTKPATKAAATAAPATVDTDDILLNFKDGTTLEAQAGVPALVSRRIGDRLEEFRLQQIMRDSAVEDVVAAPAPALSATVAAGDSTSSANTVFAGAGVGVGAGSKNDTPSHTFASYGWRTGPEVYDDEVVRYDTLDGAVAVHPDGSIQTGDRLGVGLDGPIVAVDKAEVVELLSAAAATNSGVVEEEEHDSNTDGDTAPLSYKQLLKEAIFHGDVMAHLSQFLQVRDLGRLGRVSKALRKATSKSAIWRPRCEVALEMHSRSSLSTVCNFSLFRSFQLHHRDCSPAITTV